jgi:ribosomal protein S21
MGDLSVTLRVPYSEQEFDKMVKRFKKMVDNSGVLQEVKDRRYYVKPSVAKRLKLKQRIYEENKNKKLREE